MRRAGPLLVAALLACGEGKRSAGPDAAGSASGDGGDAADATRVGVWSPSPGTTWQWQLTGAIDTSLDVAMYDIDLFDASDAAIETLRADRRVVICYFSAGSHEDWRPDAADFPSAAIGKPLDGWAGERWLDVRDPTVRTIMEARIGLAVARGCHGVEPDNVDAYTNPSGFPLTATDQLDFNRFLAAAAHARGLSIGLKNDVDQIPELVGDFDWALNEESVRYHETATLAPFVDAGKAVFHAEYGTASTADDVCAATAGLGFSTLIKRRNLDAWRVTCP